MAVEVSATKISTVEIMMKMIMRTEIAVIVIIYSVSR